ncbi:hypothetical protein CVH10_22425, partial [Halomonas sp. ND22Bw]|uniref:hypothetical protein n=1 Tax=Halomonas sp. ND22Bw TaxID=2054178 RepID=UPI000D28766D
NSDFDIFVGGKRAGGFHFDHAHADDTPYRFITMIPQAGTEAVLIEALKGDLFDFRAENVARNWATAYDNFPAVKEGRLIKEEFPD